MLTLKIGGREYYDELQNRFIIQKEKTIRLEHSLRSLARWESKWNLPFLSTEKTREQTIDYYWCMDVSGMMDRSDFIGLTSDQERQIEEYITAKMSAATITRRGAKRANRSSEIVTAETIYFWMLQYGVPPEYERWHLNRLLMLLEVCALKGGPQQKMSMRDQMAQQRLLNESRKSKYKTRG